MKKLVIFSSMSMLVLLMSCSTHKHSHGGAQEAGFMGAYQIDDAQYGTKTTMKIVGDQRVMATNALPNHETGDFPNSGNPNRITAQESKYTFPVEAKYVGKARSVKEPGVSLNGIKFDPGTNERVECESGEMFRIEAIQDFEDLGLDLNNAHVQPTGAYHYHGVASMMVDKFDTGSDLVHVGFAKDGFRIMYSKNDTYKPGYKLKDELREGTDCTYDTRRKSKIIEIEGSMPDGHYTSDWEFDESIGDLDECNGIKIDDEYVYLITQHYPFVSRCLMGEFTEKRGGPGGREGRHGPPPLRKRG